MSTKWQESIVKRFIEEISPTQQFTDSYDDFVGNRVRELISLSRPIRASYYANEGEKFISLKNSLIMFKNYKKMKLTLNL